MSKIRVAVLRGGPGGAYDESLKTGALIISLLRESPVYAPVDVFISRQGEWHKFGVLGEPHEILRHTDVVWNTLHGEYGEGGPLHKILVSMGHPYVGSHLSSSLFSHHKHVAKDLYKAHGLRTPEHTLVSLKDFDEGELIRVFQTYLHPVIVKPATGVRGVGVRLAHTFHDLLGAVKSAFAHSPKVLVEEYVRGTVSTCAVVEKAKGEDLYALIPSHLETELRRVRPSPEHNREIEKMAKLAHQALGLRHYSSSDFIITPSGKIYILETNAQPVFYEDSPLHNSLLASGWKPQDFVHHSLELALGQKIGR